MSESSTFETLAANLRALLTSLSPGERLPSSRELIEQYRVSPVTVSRAIALLAAEGAVVTRPGSGTYVATRVGASGESADTAWQTIALSDRAVDTRSVADVLGPPSPGTVMLDG